MPAFLPYGRQTIEDDDIAAVAEALRGDFLTTGPKVAEFEGAFARAVGAAEAVASNSGTAALHLAALALDLKPGEAAIVPTLTFLATANAVRMTGADVVFADVDADTGLMTPATFVEALKRADAAGLKVTAAFPVHLNGQSCDMAGIAALAAPRGIALVEDACHALGGEGIGACVHSKIACFSTHPVKTIATGEGGVTTTQDAALAKRMRLLRNHGMHKTAAEFTNRAYAFDGEAVNPWYYEMPEFGWNYRMPDILCALGISQIGKLERFIARRRDIVVQYDRLLAPLAPKLKPVPHGTAPHGWHLYAVLMDFSALGTTRRAVMKALADQGIGSQVHYLPVHLQPYYAGLYGQIDLPGARAYYERCLSIPFYPTLSDADVARVAAALAKLVG